MIKKKNMTLYTALTVCVIAIFGTMLFKFNKLLDEDSRATAKVLLESQTLYPFEKGDIVRLIGGDREYVFREWAYDGKADCMPTNEINSGNHKIIDPLVLEIVRKSTHRSIKNVNTLNVRNAK